MNRNEISSAASRRNPMRRWLGIEFSAYVVGCVLLVTTAWENGTASNAAAFVAWAVAAGFVALIAEGLYRKHIRSRQLDRRHRPT
jgi:hypothetical protein